MEANWSGQISPPRQEEGEFPCGVLSDISVVPECYGVYIPTLNVYSLEIYCISSDLRLC